MSMYKPGFLMRVAPFIPSDTDELPEGSTNLYFTKQRVRDTPLASILLTDKSQIQPTDDIWLAINKLQAQIIAGKVLIEEWGLITNPATEFADYGVITAAATQFEDYEDIVYGG